MENSPSWTRLEVPNSRQSHSDYFSTSSGSLSPFPTSPSSSLASTVVASDSPAPPLSSLADGPSPRPFKSAVHNGLNQDGEPLLPFPLLPGTNQPNVAACAQNPVSHSCRHCKEKKRKCLNPNNDTQCLGCFEKNFACGYVEQSTRREGKKEIDPTRISKVKRWSLREGLEEARPPLVRLLETEAETSRLLHKKFVGKSKPNTDPFTFLTCFRAIELGLATLNVSSSSTSLPSTSTSTPSSLHPPLPYLSNHPHPHPHPQPLLAHSASTSSLPSTLSSSSSLYTPSPSSSSSYNNNNNKAYRLPLIPAPPPACLTRADSWNGLGGVVTSSGGTKRRRTNPDGMISLGMIGLGIENREVQRREEEEMGEF
ncbi:hypothetical protein BDY24DRAFT_391593 [Mrakia frigida]|uniref:Zn(II)2Cys6 transcription factor domain-containing protein n=1 Tax=Mrakia frigida TaxID=29902 RepID=UPI003FCC2716